MDTRSRPAPSAVPISRHQERAACSLCSGELVQAQGRLMACGKIFCSDCVLDLVLTHGGSSTVACPICLQTTTLTPNRAQEPPASALETTAPAPSKADKVLRKGNGLMIQEPPASALETTAPAPSRADKVLRKGNGLMIQFCKQVSVLHETVESKVEDQRQKATALCFSLHSESTRDFLALQRDALRVSHALDDVTAAVASRNTSALLDAASENATLGGVMTGRPARNLAPTLQAARSADTETALSQFLGEASHVEVEPDFTPETVHYMCQVGDLKGGPREIKWITPYHTSDDAKFLCRGDSLRAPLLCLDTVEQASGPLTVSMTSEEVKDEGQVGVVQLGESRRFHPLGWPGDGACWLHLSKTEPQMALGRHPSGAVAVCFPDILDGEDNDDEEEGEAAEVVVEAGAIDFEIDALHPTAFDVSSCGEFFAVVEAASAEDSAARYPSEKSEVRLYMPRRKKAVSVYRPDTLPFCPSDVCFFDEINELEVKLLISDWHQDQVHVVSVTPSGGLQFERHLSAADGDLVKPTAINTDTSGGVWVGCSTGAVLHYTQRDIYES